MITIPLDTFINCKGKKSDVMFQAEFSCDIQCSQRILAAGCSNANLIVFFYKPIFFDRLNNFDFEICKKVIFTENLTGLFYDSWFRTFTALHGLATRND